MYRRLTLLLLPLALLPAFADESAVSVPGESRAAASRIAEAATRLADKRVAEGVEILAGMIEAGGNDLVPLPGNRSVAARRACHALLSRQPAATLALYRKKAEPVARRLLDRADEGDSSPLYRVIDEAFCTPSALESLNRLGDEAFVRGHFAEAESWWRLGAPLEPLPASDRDTLAYPDPPPARAARLRAKQVLARIYDRRPGVDDAVAAYRALHPDAKGNLAGRDGVYADTLAAVAQARPAAFAEGMPTFGGGPGRAEAAAAGDDLPTRLGLMCRGGPAWRFDLATGKTLSVPPFASGLTTETEAARRMAFHPVVAGKKILVADAVRVVAYDARAGKAETWFDGSGLLAGTPPRPTLPAAADLRFTLSLAGDCVLARVGVPEVRDVRRPDKGDVPERLPGLRATTDSLIVCLNLNPGAGGSRERWVLKASSYLPREAIVFEGAPLVHDGRFYVAATRFDRDQVITAVHCYGLSADSTPPPLLWKTDVAQTRELQPRNGAGADSTGERYERTRHHLLTLAGSQIVYCSHSGVVAAVEARTGRRSWAMRYPIREKPTATPEETPGHDLRDLAPAAFANGRVYVAPADSGGVWCLDPATGATMWHRENLDVVHLLGVGGGRLIFTTHRAPGQGRLQEGGLRAVDALDGTDGPGWSLPDDGGGRMPCGRGLLAGDLVLWPTFRKPFGVFAVTQAEGLQPDNPTLLHRVPSGNMVYANGMLVVTDARTMSVFVEGAR